MDYFIHVLVLAAINGMLALSLALLAGHAGLISLAHASFFGFGAYGAALIALGVRQPDLAFTALACVVSAAALSLFVSIPCTRLSGDYLVIATLGFQTIITSLFNNMRSVTNGPQGVAGIPLPRLFGAHITEPWQFLVVAMMTTSGLYLIVTRILNTAAGRLLHALRADETFTRSLGRDTFGTKVAIFAFAAGVAALAGVIYAHYITFIDPGTFSASESIVLLSMVIAGGAGSVTGPLVGALVLTLVPEALRFVGVPGPTTAAIRQMLYGLLLVAVMLARPSGIHSSWQRRQ
jgi:branched-chain amino acid transport system permease protein